MNSVQLVGLIGKTPILKNIGAKQTAVVKFSMATKESARNADGTWTQKSTWHNIVAWGKTAEFVDKFFFAGSWIGIKGRLTYSEYEKDGKKIHRTEIVADSVEFVGPKVEPKADEDLSWLGE